MAWTWDLAGTDSGWMVAGLSWGWVPVLAVRGRLVSQSGDKHLRTD